MKDATRQIQPKDIDTGKHFFDAFGKREREVSAKWIVRFCQHRELGWTPFTYKEIDDFYRSKGMLDGFWMNGLENYGIVPDKIEGEKRHKPTFNHTYTIHHEFVSRCYKASPAGGRE